VSAVFGMGTGVPSPPGVLVPAAFKLSNAARAMGTACCLSFAACVTSAATMICSRCPPRLPVERIIETLLLCFITFASDR